MPGKVDLGQDERVVYVVPESFLDHRAADQVDLAVLWSRLWSGKWLIASVTLVAALLSVCYALLATEWFRAEVLLAPAEERSTPALPGQLGGLAALAGVSVGNSDVAQAVAALKSREFARSFIEDHGLLPVFFSEKWDAERASWRGDAPADQPDMRDAVRYFHERVLRVSEDRRTGFVTVAVEWTDPNEAASWANELVTRINARQRERALREATSNIDFLERELGRTNIVTLQQSIGRVLEAELQKMMLARVSEEFSFQVIDPAEPPRRRVRPQRAMVAIGGTIAGFILGALVALTPALRSSATSSPRR